MTVSLHRCELVCPLLVVLAAPLWAASPATEYPQAIPVWRSDFENKYLKEWSYLGKERFARDGQLQPGWTEAYTITDENVFTGKLAYKGWIKGTKSKSHRAYPCHRFKNVPSPIVNSWYVWLDVDSSRFNTPDWIHFATWCNSYWGPGLHTMSVRTRSLKLEMAHCKWKWVGPGSMRRFPLKRWVRFTYYAHYAPAGDGTIWIWMDGTLIFKAEKKHVNQNFVTAHWGMYAHGNVDNGVQYNDDIKVWRLSAPWPDSNTEPPSPYGPYKDPRTVAQQRNGSRRVSRRKAEGSPNGSASRSKGRTLLLPIKLAIQKPKPAAPTAEQVALAKQAAAKLRELIVSGVAQGRQENIFIEFAGRIIRARLVAASAEGGTVQAQGVESPLDWERLSPRHFYGIARKYTADRRLLASYCRGMGMTREADEEDLKR